jgi:hypothetical protein
MRLVVLRQVLYHLSHCLPALASNLDFPDLWLLSSWITGRIHRHPDLTLIFSLSRAAELVTQREKAAGRCEQWQGSSGAGTLSSAAAQGFSQQ